MEMTQRAVSSIGSDSEQLDESDKQGGYDRLHSAQQGVGGGGGVSWLLWRSVQCGGEFESGPLDVKICQFGNIW